MELHAAPAAAVPINVNVKTKNSFLFIELKSIELTPCGFVGEDFYSLNIAWRIIDAWIFTVAQRGNFSPVTLSVAPPRANVRGVVPPGWDNFFVAEAGGAAALAGFLFVALSINLQRILSFPNLPGRAGETLVMLFSVRVADLLGLVPQNGPRGFCIALVALGAAWGAISHFRSYQRQQESSWLLTGIVLGEVPPAGYLLAGALLISGSTHAGMVALVVTTLACLAAGLINVWVLLVEILR